MQHFGCLSIVQVSMYVQYTVITVYCTMYMYGQYTVYCIIVNHTGRLRVFLAPKNILYYIFVQ